MSAQPAYVGGDPRAYVDVETRWVWCPDDECGFEGYAEVEFLDQVTYEFVCPRCDALGTDEIGGE